MNNLEILDCNTINIFCDASIKTVNNTTYGCPGSVVVSSNGLIIEKESTILVDSTNNESEIYAILLATQQAIKYKHYKRVNIFSDSRISVMGLRDWMKSWIKRSKNGILMSTSGIVANQQIFLHVLHLIINNLDEYHLYHIDGHCSSNRNIMNAIKDFKKFNKKEITYTEAIYLCSNNNLIDQYTGEVLDNTNLYNLQRQQAPFIYPIPAGSDINRDYSAVFDN